MEALDIKKDCYHFIKSNKKDKKKIHYWQNTHTTVFVFHLLSSHIDVGRAGCEKTSAVLENVMHVIHFLVRVNNKPELTAQTIQL